MKQIKSLTIIASILASSMAFGLTDRTHVLVKGTAERGAVVTSTDSICGPIPSPVKVLMNNMKHEGTSSDYKCISETALAVALSEDEQEKLSASYEGSIMKDGKAVEVTISFVEAFDNGLSVVITTEKSSGLVNQKALVKTSDLNGAFKRVEKYLNWSGGNY